MDHADELTRLRATVTALSRQRAMDVAAMHAAIEALRQLERLTVEQERAIRELLDRTLTFWGMS